MKISIDWLKELVNLKVPIEELVRLLPLRTIGLKEVTQDYIELDMKGYNRADLLSLRGVALEVSAITDSKIKFEEEEVNFPDLPKVNVNADRLSPVYCIAKIENLNVEASDDTWVKKLNSSGIRSINNVADVTNLIMLEFGQPMHAFDAASVFDETIIVRAAKNGEKLVTLDNKERVLSEKDLLITDPKKALGLAGVIGGKNSEISEKTSTILLEAAIFDPITLRTTSTKLGLQSEASKRFYHGLTKKRLLQALSKAIKMYKDLGGKLTALTIVENLTDRTLTLPLTQNRVNSLIGVEIASEAVEKYLTKLHFTLASQDQVWEVKVPYWRLDINIEEDLIEEVARMYGYEKIPAKPLNNNIPSVVQNPIFGLIQSLKEAISSLGLTEVQTYSYFSTNVIQSAQFRVENLLKIANPISKETEYLRSEIAMNLAEVIAKNVRQGIKDIAIFEIGKIYYIKEGDVLEKYVLSMALMNGTDNPLSELYEMFNKLNQEFNFGIKQTEKVKGANYEAFHPNRFIQLAKDQNIVGSLAEVHKRITDKLGISQRVAVLEIGLNKLLKPF